MGINAIAHVYQKSTSIGNEFIPIMKYSVDKINEQAAMIAIAASMAAPEIWRGNFKYDNTLFSAISIMVREL